MYGPEPLLPGFAIANNIQGRRGYIIRAYRALTTVSDS